MERKELLIEWLLRERNFLKNIQEEMDSLEKEKERDQELNKLKVELIDQWLEEDYLTSETREELSAFSDHLNDESDDAELRVLKENKQSTEFVIDKIKKELNIEQ